MKKPILIGVGALLLIGIAVGITLVLVGGDEPSPEDTEEVLDEEGDEEDEEGAADSSVYHEFHPNFVVNIFDKSTDRTRFLAIDLAASAPEQADIDALKKHMPAMRNDLIMLFSSQDVDQLHSVEGKETLRKQTLEVVRKVMEQKYGEPAIDDVYFNKFVIQ